MQSKAATVAAYLKEMPDDARKQLTKLRQLIRATVPDAKESTQYGMPAYDLERGVCAFAAQKQYFVFYTCYFDPVAKFEPLLGKVNCGKSCIRFKHLDELNLDVLKTQLVAAAEVARKLPDQIV